MKVISLACFRSPSCQYEKEYKGDFFVRQIPTILLAYANLFPGWTVQIYHDDSVLRGRGMPVAYALKDIDPRLVELHDAGRHYSLCSSMLWRLSPLNDDRVSRFIARDIDSMPSPREAAMVKEWEESGKTLHCIHDSTSHSGPMMGGMIGLVTAPARNLMIQFSIKVPYYEKRVKVGRHDLDLDQHGTDQVWMNLALWPLFADSSLIHKKPTCQPQANEAHGGCVIRNTIAHGEVAPECLPHLSPTVCREADAVSPHVGAPFDFERGYAFWDKHGTIAAPAGAIIVAGACRPKLKRRALIATDCTADYAFIAPIAAAFWRHVCGRDTTCLLMHEAHFSSWSGSNDSVRHVVLDALRAFGADVHSVACPEGYRMSTASQCARLLASSLPIDDDELVITSDADMLPIGREFFNRPMAGDVELNLYYANAYADAYPHFPMCYIEATSKTWAEIVPGGRASAANLDDHTNRHLSARLGEILAGLGKEANQHDAWNYDELWLSQQIASWKGYPGKIRRIDRRGGPPVDRLDRSHWPKLWPELTPAEVQKYSDVHLFRPCHPDERWVYIQKLARALLPEWVQNYLEIYRARFLEALK